MFNNTIEVLSADAKAQIMSMTNGFSNNEKARISELFKENEKIGYGYITVPSIMEDQLVLNTIRYKDTKDIYFKHLLSWFELDFAWYDKESKQVMLWGEYDKVKESIIELKELLENTLQEKYRIIDQEKERNLQLQEEMFYEREAREYDPLKHT
jgi:hypothetical protein